METEQIKLWLGIAAALMHIGAYVIYNVQTNKGTSKPNPASWAIWAFMSALNAAVYLNMSMDTSATLQFFAGSVMSMFTFLFAFARGKLSKLTEFEWFVLTVCVVAIVVWHVFGSVWWASMILLSIFVVSFEPTIRGVVADPGKETSLPWAIWTAAFAVTTFNKALSEDGNVLALLVPIVLLVLHGLVGWFARSSRKERQIIKRWSVTA